MITGGMSCTDQQQRHIKHFIERFISSDKQTHIYKWNKPAWIRVSPSLSRRNRTLCEESWHGSASQSAPPWAVIIMLFHIKMRGSLCRKIQVMISNILSLEYLIRTACNHLPHGGEEKEALDHGYSNKSHDSNSDYLQ